jgi:hypothetical protein
MFNNTSHQNREGRKGKKERRPEGEECTSTTTYIEGKMVWDSSRGKLNRNVYIIP